MNTGLICWSCGRPTDITHKPTRNDYCPHCDAGLRTCRGCRHFDPTRRSQCRETIDAPVRDKDKNNFCDWFQPRQATKRAGGVDTSHTDTKDDRRQRFDDLFED